MSIESDRHNRLAPAILRQIITETGNEADAMVVLESVMLGLMLYYRPDPRHAGEYMDIMTTQVIERMRK